MLVAACIVILIIHRRARADSTRLVEVLKSLGAAGLQSVEGELRQLEKESRSLEKQLQQIELSIAGWEGTSFAAHWGPAGGLRRELRVSRVCCEARYGTDLPARWQSSMVA